MRRAVICLVLVLLCSTGCESSLESVEAEDFDADHGLRSLRHERGLDFEWVNIRMQHVVLVEFGAETCSGVLVAPDLVLTAAHCLRDTAYMDDVCGLDEAPGGGTIPEGNVILDHQFEQDTHTNGDPGSGIRRTPRRAVGIVEIVAHPRTNVFEPVFTPRRECRFPLSMRHFDGVLLRLQTPVLDRGFARLRTADPQPGELMPVIHNLFEKTVSAVVIQPDASPGGGEDDPSPDAHIGREIDFPILPVIAPEQLVDIDEGSSGAPLFPRALSRRAIRGSGGGVSGFVPAGPERGDHVQSGAHVRSDG